jgi:hypothetical protein
MLALKQRLPLVATLALLAVAACDDTQYSPYEQAPKPPPAHTIYEVLHHNATISDVCPQERTKLLEENKDRLQSLTTRLVKLQADATAVGSFAAPDTSAGLEFIKGDKIDKLLVETVSLLRHVSGPDGNKQHHLLREMVALRGKLMGKEAEMVKPFLMRALHESKVREFLFKLAEASQSIGVSPTKEWLTVSLCLNDSGIGTATSWGCSWGLRPFAWLYGLDLELTRELFELGKQLVREGVYADAKETEARFKALWQNDLLGRVNNLLAIMDLDPKAAMAAPQVDAKTIDLFFALLNGALPGPEVPSLKKQLDAKNYPAMVETLAGMTQRPELLSLKSDLEFLAHNAYSLYAMTNENNCQVKPFLSWDEKDFEANFNRLIAFLEDTKLGLPAHLQFLRIVLASSK